MATAGFGDIGGRSALARSVYRRAVARAIAVREQHWRRRVNAYLLGLDDAGLATFAADRRSVDEAGRGALPF